MSTTPVAQGTQPGGVLLDISQAGATSGARQWGNGHLLREVFQIKKQEFIDRFQAKRGGGGSEIKKVLSSRWYPRLKNIDP